MKLLGVPLWVMQADCDGERLYRNTGRSSSAFLNFGGFFSVAADPSLLTHGPFSGLRFHDETSQQNDDGEDKCSSPPGDTVASIATFIPLCCNVLDQGGKRLV